MAMLTSITMNYDSRDFFGQYEFKSDTYEGIIDRAMIRKVVNAVQNHTGYYAHFNRDDGSDDCITSGMEKGTFRLTHFDSWNSRDDEVIVKVADFRKRLFDEVDDAR